jgi:hypothetical protein
MSIKHNLGGKAKAKRWKYLVKPESSTHNF